MVERLVVIGGDAAGMTAASQARRLRTPAQLEIVAFERGGDTSYSACGIPFWVGDVVADRADLVVRTPEEHRERDVAVHTRHEVTAIDTDAGTVRVTDLTTGAERDEPYDQLLIATGASPVRPPVPGVHGPGVFGVQTLDDGQAVIDHLEALSRKRPRAVVVGGGYIGLEMAEAFVTRGMDVHLVDRSECPMRTIDPDMGGRIAEAMEGMGVTLHLGVDVEAIRHADDGALEAVVTSDGDVPADVVVLGTGTRPDSDLAAAAGIPVGPETGGIVVDLRQRTRVEGVWAAGDCAEVHHRVKRAPTAIALGTIANKTGRVAGINLGGGYATFPGVLGTAITKVCGLEIARTGLGEDEARAAGFEPVTIVVESTTTAGYWPRPNRSPSRSSPSVRPGGCSERRSSATPGPASASTRWRRPCGTRWASTSSCTSTCPTRRRSRRRGTPC